MIIKVKKEYNNLLLKLNTLSFDNNKNNKLKILNKIFNLNLNLNHLEYYYINLNKMELSLTKYYLNDENTKLLNITLIQNKLNKNDKKYINEILNISNKNKKLI
jgi:hypothetical protein